MPPASVLDMENVPLVAQLRVELAQCQQELGAWQALLREVPGTKGAQDVVAAVKAMKIELTDARTVLQVRACVCAQSDPHPPPYTHVHMHITATIPSHDAVAARIRTHGTMHNHTHNHTP